MPPSRRPGQPWHASVNVDLFARLVRNTALHPFICWLVPLCLRAAETPWSEPAMVNTIAWAVFISVLSLLQPLNERLAYGSPRPVDHEEEVIVVTGGASGLGRCLAEIYAMKGASLAVVDKSSPAAGEELEGVDYYQCDLTDAAAVTAVWEKITQELGVPTVLINNAGVVSGKRLQELSGEEVARTFHTNAISHYTLNKLFLPPLLKSETGGTIVTISSVLAYLGAAQLSDYTASKAALVAMHKSLAAELRPYPFLKTILVTPGQLSTDMFNGLEQQTAVQNFFGPTVEVSELAMSLVKMIGEGRGGVLAEPVYARWISLLDFFPVGLQQLVRDLTGVDQAMQKFKPLDGTAGSLGSWEVKGATYKPFDYSMIEKEDADGDEDETKKSG